MGTKSCLAFLCSRGELKSKVSTSGATKIVLAQIVPLTKKCCRFYKKLEACTVSHVLIIQDPIRSITIESSAR